MSPTRPFRRAGSRFARASARWAVVFSGVAAGCSADPTRGYSSRPIHDDAVRTIAVPVFENLTYQRGLEVQLTEAVVKELQRTTRWAVTDSSRAETTLRGTLTRADLRPLTLNRSSGLVQEMAVQLTVDFDWTESGSGAVRVSRRGFAASETFVPARPAAEPVELGQHAAIQQLARDIVAELASAW